MQRGLTDFTMGAVLLFCSTLFAGEPMAMPKNPDPAKVESGTVVETMKVPGYTYMLVDHGAGQSWVAIPETDVATGAKIRYTSDMTMNNFTSKTLNKTFETIVFSAGLMEDGGAAAPKPAADDSFDAAVKSEQQKPAAESAMPETSGGSSGAIAPLQENIAVAKAQGENGYTVEELFTRAKELGGKKVRVQGKVVKFSPNIMGKNWVHVQDGTGNPMQNTHDLVITTGETVEMNSVVTLEGTLAADKDFGAGYKYAAIIEQAKLIK